MEELYKEIAELRALVLRQGEDISFLSSQVDILRLEVRDLREKQDAGKE